MAVPLKVKKASTEIGERNATDTNSHPGVLTVLVESI